MADKNDRRRSRAWVWTSYETEPPGWTKAMNYLLYVKQKCPTTDRIHWQGYSQFKKRLNMFRVQQQIGKLGFMDRAGGRLADNQRYIKDDEKKTNQERPYEIGDPEDIEPEKKGPGQGARMDLKAAINDIKEGKKSWFEMKEDHLAVFAKYPRFLKDYAMEWKQERREEIKWPVVLPWATIEKPDPARKKRHLWIWGPPDSGKTFGFTTALRGKKYFTAGKNKQYRFEGYNNQDIILFDDVLPELCELLDCTNTYENDTERSGGSRYERTYWPTDHTRTVVVLSNHDPAKWPASFHARFNVIEIKPKSDEVRGIPDSG